MEKDINAIACNDVGNNSRSCDREFANDAMKGEVPVVSIKVQVGIRKRKGVRSKAVVDGGGNANVRRKRSENGAVVIKDIDKMKMPLSLMKVTSRYWVLVSFTADTEVQTCRQLKLQVIAIWRLIAVQ